MRVLKVFFTSIVLLLIVAVVGGLISREILLSIALRQLRSDMKFLSQSSTASGDFFKDCLEYGTSFDETGSMVKNQIRFVSDSSYVLESVCKASTSIRKVVKSKSLPPLVRRAKGGSGLVQGDSNHGVELSIFGRSGVVYEYENMLFSATSNLDDLDVVLNEGPATICSGYGYVCCNEGFQTGQDYYQEEALDCPRSCYASCSEKPVILNFNSEPSVDPETKIVWLNSGDFIEFVYTVSDIKGDIFAQENLFEEDVTSTWSDKLLSILDKYANQDADKKDSVDFVIISFGDGTSEKLLDLHGRSQHTYTCDKSICIYNVTVQATTKLGLTSSLDNVAKLQVNVRH